MNELIAKLTNLSYDFFGILLPGMIFNIFALLLWYALGPLVPAWTTSGISELSLDALLHLVDTLSLGGRIFAAIPLIFLWYFLGHLLHWFGRSDESNPDKTDESTDTSDAPIHWHRRVRQSLIFRIPKPERSFNQKLKPLYAVVQRDFSPPEATLKWKALFPVVKCYLARNLSISLVTTYQNRYSLHRSITTASTFLFWFSLLGIIGGLVMHHYYDMEPHWVFLIMLPVGALILVWGFSGSYLYNWMLFGNTIVTEAYSLLCAVKNEKSEK